MEAALVESETARRLDEYVAARVAEVVASDAVQQSLKARLSRERKVGLEGDRPASSMHRQHLSFGTCHSEV